MFPAAQIPEVKMSTVLAIKKELWHQPVFDHVRCAPLAGNHRIVSEVPPKIVSQKLWSTINFPLTQHLERIMIQKKHATRSFAFGISQTANIDSFRTTMNRVQPGITSPVKDFFGLNYLHDLRLPGIGLGIKDVDTR